MEYITAATEKRINEMVKKGHRYGEVLSDVLTCVKRWNGCDGATIKELKSYDMQLENNFQVNVFECDRKYLNGLSIIYNDLIDAVFCLDLHYVNVTDFNKLVKKVSEMENDGYGTY